MVSVKITNHTKRRLEFWFSSKDDSRMATRGIEPHQTIGVEVPDMVKIPVSLFAKNEADVHIQIMKDYGEDSATKDKIEFPDTEPCGFVKPHEIDRRANTPTPKNEKNKSQQD